MSRALARIGNPRRATANACHAATILGLAMSEFRQTMGHGIRTRSEPAGRWREAVYQRVLLRSGKRTSCKFRHMGRMPAPKR